MSQEKPVAYQIKQDHSVVIYVDGKIHTVNSTDLNYNIVINALKVKDWATVKNSLSIKKIIADHTDGQVEIYGNDVYVKGKMLHNAISKRIVTLVKSNNFDLSPVFRLLENIESNPESYSRDELYLFLDQNDLPFTPDGHFLAYKMVNSDYKDIYTGTIDNSVGATPTMARKDVDPDRNNTCSYGYHFCSYDYLSDAYVNDPSYRLMVVKINPCDVVSIPRDYNNAKGRCCRYEVVEELPHHADTITKNFTKEHDSSTNIKQVSHTKDDSIPSNSSAKLNEDKVREIKRALLTDRTIKDIATEFGISPRQVGRIRDGEAWADVTI